MRINKQYKIIKATKKSIVGAIFEYVIINKGESVQPKWFRDWADAFEKRINNQFEKNEKENDARWTANDAHWQRQEEFNKAQLEFNQLMLKKWEKQEEFNKYVLEVFKRNKLK